MIKIDLTPKAKGESKFSLGGLDKINVKNVILAVIFLYGGVAVVQMYYDDQLDKFTELQTQNQAKLNASQKRLRELNNIKGKVDALKAQEQRLADRLEAVKVVIEQRQNPFRVLTYVAENSPATLWLNTLSLKGKELSFEGHSENWKEIGGFLDALKSSIFFSNIRYAPGKTPQSDYNGVKVEDFIINTAIKRFK